MKIRPIILMLMFIHFAAGLWVQQVFGANKLPVAVISETEYRFKSILEGDKIVHDFILQNAGDAPLFIKKVRTG